MALIAALSGCGGSDGLQGGAPAAGVEPSTTQHLAAAYTGPDARYDYRLISTCGERDGLGTFHVKVRHGVVVDAKPADRWSRLPHDPDLIPTLDGFVDMAERAQGDGADEVRLTMRQGHPGLLSIDWERRAIDDELCWRATEVRA